MVCVTGDVGSAPVSKAIVIATGTVSVFLQATRGSHRRSQGQLPPPLSLLAFSTPGELVFGVALLYCFKLFERQSGSNKYGANVVLVSTIAYGLQLALHNLLQLPYSPVSGPYGLIYASFVRFFFDVPPSSSFTVLGIKMSDKVFLYLAGLQLLMSNGRASLLAGGCGAVAGLLYHLNFLGIKRLRPPAFVSNFLRGTLGPLLAGNPQPVPRGAPAATAGQQPLRAPAAATPPAQRAAAPPPPPPEAIQQLVGMGFPEARAVWALQQVNNDMQAAINLLL